MNRLIKSTDRLGKCEQYIYYTGSEITSTTGNNLKAYVDKSNRTTTFNSYDQMDRLINATLPDGTIIQYSYDINGRVVSISDSNSGIISFVYDVLDRVIQETTPLGTINYTYDALGRRTTMSKVGEPLVGYNYDNANRLIAISKVVGINSRNYTFDYDNSNRQTALHIPLVNAGAEITTNLTFDAGNHLVSLTHLSPGMSESIHYSYDNNGNKVSMTRGGTLPIPWVVEGTSYDEEYEMLTYNGNSLTYDETGNLVSKKDVDGNTTTYSWDARNRLVAISGPTSAPSLSAAFKYDVLNRRIEKTINGVTTKYVYDGNDIVQEIIGGNKINYIRTLDIDEPLSKVDDNGLVYHYIRDGLGSIIGIVDDLGNKISLIHYDPFGNSLSTESFGFNGRENDSTGLIYYRYRYYSPEMGRFISRDPLGFAAGDANFYGYVSNNPINWRDPYGLDATSYLGDGRSIPNGPKNGNWGGINWSGGWNPQQHGGEDGPLPPTDSADICYMHHDHCYGFVDKQSCGGGEHKKSCDSTLLNCLRKLSHNPEKWALPPKKGTENMSEAFRTDANSFFIMKTRK